MTRLLLRLAAWLAPDDLRGDWLAEWSAELAYVRRVCGARRAWIFCSGAFADALWLRRHATPRRPVFHLDSPARSLGLLALFALASLPPALRQPDLRDILFPPPYRESERLAMVLHAPRGAPLIAQYRTLAVRNSALAFYTRVDGYAASKRFTVALSSANLFALLGVPAPARGLIISRGLWRRRFHSDPRILGRTVEVDGARVAVTGILPTEAWRLPGIADAWLLDDARIAALPADSRGFLLARLPVQLPSGAKLTFAPLPRVSPVIALLVLTGMAFIMFPAVTPWRLGTAALRPALFLAAKIALLLPATVCAAFALGMPGAVLMLWMFAARWAFADQRRRCPVCLHLLAHPARIGEASHTFLDWYGAELLCPRGHGMLHVPEIHASAYPGARWLSLDPSLAK